MFYVYLYMFYVLFLDLCSITRTAFMRQAVACATAVATYGGATHAAKCEMRDLHSAASHHQVGELAEGTEPPEPMPEPLCAA